MRDEDDFSDAQTAQIEKRIGQTFAFVRDVIDDPHTLEDIPSGSRLVFRDVVIQQTHIRLTAYPANDHGEHWMARVTGPAMLAAEGRQWPPPSGESAAAALDALEAKLRAANPPDRISRRIASGD